ncbi:MAG TPA: hypothetical protein VGL39_27780 [Jatrophihabitantaceae bacterium]|jgi:hypothetical protein
MRTVTQTDVRPNEVTAVINAWPPAGVINRVLRKPGWHRGAVAVVDRPATTYQPRHYAAETTGSTLLPLLGMLTLGMLAAAPSGPSGVQSAVLGALQKARNLYGGTVSPETVARRRAKNRTARRSRAINRRRSS